MFFQRVEEKSGSFIFRVTVAFCVILFVVVLGPGLLDMGSSQALAKKKGKKICDATARVAFKACQNEIADDYSIAVGNCINLSVADERTDCLDDAKADWKDARGECRDQKEARLEVCQELGQAAYDPQLDPDDFVDPLTITSDTANPYFTLVPGTVWNYEAGDAGGTVIENIRVEVLSETKLIEYPAESGDFFNCIVVSDVVTDAETHEVIEDTKDWYAQDLDGNVWYMGEIAQEFEDGELVGIEGSWTAGKDFSKPGILVESDPQPDDIYRQEFALGDAEDLSAVISRNEAAVAVPAGKWSDDVLKTKDFTPIEPDVFEYKYYVPGVGCVLEENPDTGERVELISVTP